MSGGAYYNEIDPFAAQWLRNLIAAGHIAPGEVDERDIRDVRPDELAGFSQCHFFAGIGGWSYALRLAGWPDERPVWTGSCPCQPFSAAGKRLGFEDARDLWPAWFSLISSCLPRRCFGEQVSGAEEWSGRTRRDLTSIGYGFWSRTIRVKDVGGPHSRRREWFVAYSERDEQPRKKPCSRPVGRVGGIVESVPWNEPWWSALSRLRALDDGIPRNVEATDAARNAIVPQVAAEFIGAFLDCEASMQDAA